MERDAARMAGDLGTLPFAVGLGRGSRAARNHRHKEDDT